MADTRFRITTPLFFILANFAFGDVTPDIIVQSNGNFTLQPNVQSPPEDILWTWNENKVVEFYQEEMVTYGQFKGRMTLDLTTGALTLTNLTEADSGEYVGELQIKGTLVKYRQTVKVFDAVGKPAVTCQVNGSSVILLCSGGDRPSTQHRWEGPAIESQPGSQLNIEAAESSDAVYTCVLHNPVGESRTDFPVKSCFPAPGSASVIISVVIVLLLFIIVGLLLFYYKKFYKKTQNEEDMEAQSGEGQQLLSVKAENVEETPVSVQESAELGKDMQNPGKTQDEHQKTALIEQHKETDESAGISQKESQTGSQNQAEDSEERGVVTEGGNSKPPSSGTVPFSAPESPPAAPPKTGSADETVHPPKSSPSPPHPPNSPSHPATTPVQNQDQEAETKTAAESTDETGANQRAGAQRQREKRGGQDGESLNQAEDSEERGVVTEGGNSKHPSSGTVPFCAPESSSAAPPKTGSADETVHPPKSSPSPPHPPNSPPHPATAPVQNQDQEAETKTAAAAESTDETAANQRAGAQRQREKRGGQDGESLNQAEDSEERGVETEGGNSKHPASGTVAFSDSESSPAAPPKTENEEKKIHPPKSSPSPPHPANSPPHPAPAPVKNQDQEAETKTAAAAESTDETGANQRAGAPRQSEEGEGQNGGSDGGVAQLSGAGGGGAKNTTADAAQELPSSPEEEEDIQESQKRGAVADAADYGDWMSSAKQVAGRLNPLQALGWWSPGKTHDEHQKTALTEQHKGTDGSAGIPQEESQTESLNQAEHSEESGVETEAGNSKHPSSGTVPFSAPESPPAAPPKTGNEEETFHSPPSSPSPPHPPKSPPHPAPAPAPAQNQDQEAETERAATAESTDETGANQTAGAQRQREKREGQDGGSDGGRAQPSGAGGGGAENPTADPAQELPSSPEEEEDILRQGPDTDGGAAQCSEAGGGGDESVPKPDSDQDIDPTSAEENLSVPSTEPLSTADPAQGLPDTTARSPPHTGASERSCCAEESPTSGPNPEPSSTSEAEEEKKRGREERKDSQDRGVEPPPDKPPRTYTPYSP